MNGSEDSIGFGGGCHWCTEATFQCLKGVFQVDQGWISAPVPNDVFSEAVLVRFDLDLIGLDVLIEIHLRTHSSQRDHSMRSKYRSAIYVRGAEQARLAKGILDRLSADFDPRPVTQVMDLVAFKPSPPRYQNYYQENPDRPFCKMYIDPKLALLRVKFGDYV